MGNLNPKNINTTALAYLGDAVYETYVRQHVMETGQTNADQLHQAAVAYVCADGQAKAIKKMINDFLTEEEIKLVKRARNHKSSSRPRHADPVTYKLATAFEALLGYLFLQGMSQRLDEVVKKAIELIEER